MNSPYPVRRPARSEFLSVRGLRHHIRHWGPNDAPTLFMLHGWMDMSASFQFLVDALAQEWHVIAPDWRGFGQTEWAAEAYWFPEYMADLDAILDHYAPESTAQEAVNLIGHSMGGNIAMCYAGVRPRRIAKLVNLEGFGLPSSTPSQAPGRYAKWLNQVKAQRTEPARMGTYANLAEAAGRLQKSNPRLSAERAAFLAAHWATDISSEPDDQRDSPVTWQADPRHKNVNPVLYRLDEMLACWQQITAPVLWVTGAESELLAQVKAGGDYPQRVAAVAQVECVEMAAAGHMLQHDQPAQLAVLIESFLSRHDTN